jgi:3-oxoacyl-[acyl-carrier-protein] synthase-3
VPVRVGLLGLGHVIGSAVIDNEDLAASMGLPRSWFVERTGIERRQVSAADEDVLSLACAAVRSACEDAGVDIAGLGNETVLLHVQNGFTHFTPPAGVVLAGTLGMWGVRVVGLDGVCAEPVAALEMATLMLQAGSCERVIVSAAVDFMSFVDPGDRNTAGLFGCGAGAVVLSRGVGRDRGATVRGLRWETHAEHWQMGSSRMTGSRKTGRGVQIDAEFYLMHGQELYRTALRTLPRVIDGTLEDAGWSRADIDLIVVHQPNVRLLELASKHLRLDLDKMPRPGRRLGNMGPASLLVNLSLARDEGRLEPGTRVLLLAFGLGFSCGAVALEV